MQESSLSTLQNASKPAMERLLSKIRPLKPRSRFEENKLDDFLQWQAKSSSSTKPLLASQTRKELESAENRNSLSQLSSPERSPNSGSTRTEFENTPSSRNTSTAVLDEQEKEMDGASGSKVSGSELISNSTELEELLRSRQNDKDVDKGPKTDKELAVEAANLFKDIEDLSDPEEIRDSNVDRNRTNNTEASESAIKLPLDTIDEDLVSSHFSHQVANYTYTTYPETLSENIRPWWDAEKFSENIRLEMNSWNSRTYMNLPWKHCAWV